MELTSVSIWSFPHMIYLISSPITIPHMACSLLNSDWVFVFVFARVVRQWFWYWASRAVISPIAYFAKNSWFWSHIAMSHSVFDTLPSNLSQMKHVLNGTIDVANLYRVLHWLSHSYVSLCLRLLALSSFKAQVNTFCDMMLNGSLIQPQCLPHH